MLDVLSYGELIKSQSIEEPYMIDNLLLMNTSIVLSACEKTGKTTLVLQLCKAIFKNDDFLDVKKGKYNVDTIVFFSNDSTAKSILLKLEKMNFVDNDQYPFYFIFNKKLTIEELMQQLDTIKKDKVLLIVDVLGGLNSEKDYDINGYTSMTSVIDSVEKGMANHFENFGIIFLHHLNKKKEVLGSRAIGSRVAAKLVLNVDEYNSQYGTLNITSNDYQSRKLFIKKDLKNHRWIIDKTQNTLEERDVEYQLLRLNETLQKCENKQISGTVNEVIAKTRMCISPKNLTRWLKKNKKYLKQNNIYYNKRKSGTTIIDIYYQA